MSKQRRQRRSTRARKMRERVRFGAGLTLFMLLLAAAMYIADQPRRRWAATVEAESRRASQAPH
jgi:hypothetical protein